LFRWLFKRTPRDPQNAFFDVEIGRPPRSVLVGEFCVIAGAAVSRWCWQTA
jgi:hypothetical protein